MSLFRDTFEARSCLKLKNFPPCRIANYPDLHFVVILNPHNGPGIADPFDANYTQEIPRLNSCSNVTTIGYVRTDYCKRPIAEVCRDILIYGGWAKDFLRSGLGVQGIFYDETPNLYELGKADYLETIDKTVKQTFGIQGQRLVRIFIITFAESECFGCLSLSLL